LQEATSNTLGSSRGEGERPEMLKVQLSIPELKAQVLALHEMAQDPTALLQSLSDELRPRFEA
jgi:hypothetical protein